MKFQGVLIAHCLVGGVLLGFAPGAEGQVDWPQLQLTQVAGGLTLPLHITSARDGSGRIFIVEQPGRIKILQTNSVLAQPFLDITNRVFSGTYYGLLSVAFPPNYAAKGYFYVYYTPNTQTSVISRFFVSTNVNQADPGSEQVVLLLTNKPCSTLLGGLVAFGPDGYLYIGTGSDEFCVDQGLAQVPDSLWGKLLRIDVESGATPYAVPASNPFVGNAAYLPEIWALGFRNPWRYSFDRLTGDLYVADVGQDAWEEIDFQAGGSAGGQNYGWPIMEGNHIFDLLPGYDTNLMTRPVAEYPHTNIMNRSSVTGGFVYRGTNSARMTGVYFYGDFYTGGFWGLAHTGTNWQVQAIPVPKHFLSTFGEDEAGELYLADLIFGKVYRISDSGLAGPPVFTPAGGTVAVDQITVTSSSPGATIHYTTNGAVPVVTDPAVGSNNTVVVTSGTTLSARAVRADLQPSTVTTGNFVLQTGIPMYSPPHGPITNGTLLSISSATPGALIRYTLDGSVPTVSAAQYAGPFPINSSNIVSAQAYRSGFSDSLVLRVYFNGAVRLNPPQILNGSFYLTWPSQVGWMYQVQVSNDLSNWSNTSVPQAGTDQTLAFGASFSTNRQFFRVMNY